MNNYVAGLNGVSVAYGTLRFVRKKAHDVFNSANWQEFEGPKATLRITSGAQQLFVSSTILEKK